MPIDSAVPTGNQLLDALSHPNRALIAPHLEPVSYARGETVFEAGSEVTHVIFPCADAVVALVVVTRDGRTAETATIGREGAMGGIVSHGHLPAAATALVQVGGPMLRLSAQRLQEGAEQSSQLRDHLARYTDCLMAQLLQNAACNALHPIDQRCLRWILTLHDRIGSDTLPITHEWLASMLGVQRTYLTRILRTLQEQGLLRVGRGRIVLLDRPGIAAAACECHARVQAYSSAVLGPISGPETDDGAQRSATGVRTAARAFGPFDLRR